MMISETANWTDGKVSGQARVARHQNISLPVPIEAPTTTGLRNYFFPFCWK